MTVSETGRDCDLEGRPSPDARICELIGDYVHPREVIDDDHLSLTDKRAILCFWASDACAVASRPGFRWLPGTPGPIAFDKVIAALRKLDDDWSGERSIGSYAWQPKRKSPAARLGT